MYNILFNQTKPPNAMKYLLTLFQILIKLKLGGFYKTSDKVVVFQFNLAFHYGCGLDEFSKNLELCFFFIS